MPKKTSDLSPAFEKASANILASAAKELQAAAKAHRVTVKVDQLTYASLAKTTILHAPIAGIEKYDEADFGAGAAIQLVIAKSTTRGGLPSGSYVVKAQFRPRSKARKVLFTDRRGIVVIRRDVTVRSWKQSAVLFPEIYSHPEPQNLPLINSSHVLYTSTGPRIIFDAAGWTPYREIWYY